MYGRKGLIVCGGARGGRKEESHFHKVENCTTGSFCCKSLQSTFTTDRTVFPHHLQLLASPSSVAYCSGTSILGLLDRGQGKSNSPLCLLPLSRPFKSLCCFSASQLFKSPSRTRLLLLGTRLTRTERKIIFCF